MELNDREAAAWEVIRTEYMKTGFAPSARQLAKALYRGYSYCGQTVNALEARGYVIFAPDRKRYIPANWRELANIPKPLPRCEHGVTLGLPCEQCEGSDV